MLRNFTTIVSMVHAFGTKTIVHVLFVGETDDDRLSVRKRHHEQPGLSKK